jgi:DNA-binding transcriptional MerR regulator
MGRKRSLDQILDLTYINIGELSLISGVRQSTLKFYCEIEILPFEQAGIGLNRKFNRVNALSRLKEIEDLKNDKHFSIEDIVTFYKKQHVQRVAVPA